MGNRTKWSTPIAWDQEVDGAKLADELIAELKRYIHITEHEHVAIVMWLLFAHTHDLFEHSPFLALQSALPGCGKSTTATVIKAHTPAPLSTSNLTRSVLYRIATTDGARPTFIIDEANTHLFRDPDAIGILNGGHARTGSNVHRTDLDTFGVQEFSVWMPKVIIYNGRPPETIADRSIAIKYRRLRNGESVETLPAGYDALSSDRNRKLARWAKDNGPLLRGQQQHVEIPGVLRNRSRDNWRPMIAIGDLLSPEWSDRVRAAAVALGANASHDIGERLLLDCWSGALEFGSSMFIPSWHLVAYLNEIPGSPWAEMNGGRGMSAQNLATALLDFDIKPHKVNRKGHQNVRGYEMSALAKALGDYSIEYDSPATTVRAR